MFVRDRKIVFFLTCLFVILPFFSIAPQNLKRIIDWPPVNGPDGFYSDPFSGGFNNIEHQFIDLDSDADYDLIYLNSDGTFGWFQNLGSPGFPQFKYSQDTIPGLNISDWFYFIDVDDDGDYDLFTGNSGYIRFLKNNGTASSASFTIESDTLKDDMGDPIISEFGSNPVFVDIDGDNDYDFISGNSAGTVTYYENIGNSVLFSFKFITNFWQGISIIGGGVDDPRHGSSSFDFTDLDSDGDFDLVWGDFFSKSLYIIENQGNQTTPMMKLISDIYPQNEDSLFTRGYNMPRFIDIDDDGLTDMFVSVLYDPTVKESLMYFKNNGTPENPNHRRVTTDYINTLDVGNNSHPILADIDNDGDLDLFIGSFNNPFGSVYFFKNTGDPENPIFEFQTDTFADVQTDLSAIPALCDIDGDGDYDLFIGKLNGKIDFYRNQGSKVIPDFIYEGELLDATQSVIDVGDFAAPFFYDIDADSDMDLVIGAFNGRFYLFENTGTGLNYVFNLNATYFNNLDVGDNSTPFLIDLDSDSKFEIYSGSRNGKVYHYKNDGTPENPVWILESDHYQNLSVGGSSSLFFVDIDNDSDTDLLLGNVKGGLYFYNNLSVNDINEDVDGLNEFSLIQTYPNPFNPFVNILVTTENSGSASLQIFNLLGEKVKDLHVGYLDAGKHLFGWDGKNDSYVSLPAGNYFILFITDKIHSSTKITYLK